MAQQISGLLYIATASTGKFSNENRRIAQQRVFSIPSARTPCCLQTPPSKIAIPVKLLMADGRAGRTASFKIYVLNRSGAMTSIFSRLQDLP